MSPKLNLRIVEVRRIGEGLAVLDALGEGDLMVSTRKRSEGYHSTASASIAELRGKTESEIYAMLDRLTDQVLEREWQRTNRN